MDANTPYAIDLDVRFAPQELIDVQSLTRVNDCVVRLGVMQGEFHWHKHDEEDEFFYVVDGLFPIDLEDRTVELRPKQGFTVPRGVVHRTRAPERTTILMFEGAGVIPTGDG